MSIITTPPQAPQGPAPERHKSWPRRHPVWTTIAAIAAVAIIGGVGTSLSSSTSSSPQPTATHQQHATQPVSQPASAPPPAPAVPNPKGTYQGSADYLIPSGIYDTVYLTGEIDLTNTGNVGIIVRCTIGWQREGQPDITASKVVRVPYGGSKVVRFHVPQGSFSGSGGTVIDEVQSWETSHMDKQLGDYHVKIIGSYGAAH